MSPVIWFVMGLVVGCLAGVFAVSMLVAGAWSDDVEDT